MESIAAIIDNWTRKVYVPIGDEIQRGYVVVDIGAHIGSFSIFASTCADQVHVYSYEPSEENYGFLTKNMSLNKIGNGDAFPLAVSRHCGKVRLCTDDKRSTHNSMFTPGASGETIREVDSCTLEQILDMNHIKRCDLLKMDCEGAEYEILFGAPAATMAKVRNISLEYHEVPGYHVHDLRRYLDTIGYDVSLSRRGSYWGPIIHARRRD